MKKSLLFAIGALFVVIGALVVMNYFDVFSSNAPTPSEQKTEEGNTEKNQDDEKNKSEDSGNGGIADSQSFGTNVYEIGKNRENSKDLRETRESEEIDQRTLFDKTRRGVVAINVSVVLDKSVYNKSWAGTGFVADREKGLIVTNAHVAGELTACSYEIKFGNGKKVEAKLEYLDPCYDFAILHVNPDDIPQYVIPLKISNENLSINTEIYSMGNSARNEFSTYKGYVFDTESILWLKPIAEQSFQFSGLTVPGASGSPVLNTKGEVVGLLYGGKFVSGAALPISYVTPVINSLRKGKRYHRYFYGLKINYGSIQDFISVGDIPEAALEEYEKAFPNSNDKILYIARNLTAYGAKDTSFEPGDIIWKVDGEMIGPNLKRIDEIVQAKEGKSITITVYRKGKKLEINAPTYEMDNMNKMRMLYFAGAVFCETPQEYKIVLGKSNTGVYVVSCDSGSAFKEVCLSEEEMDEVVPGAQIVAINGKEINTLEDMVSEIPNLFHKTVFNIKFIRLCGDPQVSALTAKHSPEFAEAKLYTFDRDKKKWQIKIINNPKQAN